MRRRYFNWKLLVVLVMGIGVLAATALGLRHWQRGRRAGQGLTLGSEAYSEGKWQDAADQLGRYLAVVPDDVDVLIKYAEAQLNIRPLKSSNVQQAIGAYRTVLRLVPGHQKAALRLSQIYIGISAPGDAEQIADRALQSTRSVELQRILAVALASQRKFTEAAARLENILQVDPNDIASYELLGKLVEQRPKDFNMTSQFWFDQAVEKNPSAAGAYIARGAYYQRHGRTAQAMDDFSQAAQKDIPDPNVRLELADWFLNARALEQAGEQLDIVADREPSSQLLWRIRGKLAIRSGSKEMMQEVARQGLQQLPKQIWDFMPIAAELYLRSDRLDLAQDCISKLKQKDISPDKTAFLEGLLAEAKGRDYEAIRCWTKAMELGNGQESLRIALANTLARLGDYRSAIRQLRALVSEQPNNIRARTDLARLLGETGSFAESLEHARAAVGVAPKDTGVALAYALARARLLFSGTKDYSEDALNDFEQYLDGLDSAESIAADVGLLKLQLAVYKSDFATADKLLSQLKNEYPSDERIVVAEADLLAAQGKTAQAESVFTNAIDTSSDSVFLVRSFARLLSQQGATRQCEQMVVGAMTRCQQPDAKKQLGLLLAGLYAGSKQHQKRCELLIGLAEEFPDDIMVLRQKLSCPAVLRDSAQSQKLVDKIKALEGEQGWQWRYEQAKAWFAGDNFKTYYPQIVTLLKENLLADPDNNISRVLLAAAYERAGEMRLAILTYDEALNRSPDDIRVIVAAAGALYRANEYERADRLLKKAAHSELAGSELKQLQLQSFMRRGEIDSAGEVLKEILVADPNNQSAALSLALLEIRLRHFDDAAELLDDLSTAEPNSLPVAAVLAELMLRQGKAAEAIQICNDAVRNLNNAEALALRGRTYAALGEKDKAEADFEQAVSIEPNNVEAQLAKIDFHRSAGQMDKAVVQMRQALELAPHDIRLCKNAVLLYLASSDQSLRREGKLLLDDALQTSPDDLELLFYKARLLMSQQTAPAIDEAKTIFEAITQRQPMASEAWLFLSEIAAGQGRSAEAIDITLRGLAYLPNDRTLLSQRARLEGARSPQLAIPTLRALRELDPNDAVTAVRLAEAYIAAHEPQEAIQLLKSQLELQRKPQNEVRLKIALAMALYKTGKQDESEEIFSVLRQSMPDDPRPLLAQVRLLKDDGLWNQLDLAVAGWCQLHPDDVNVPLVVAKELAASKEDAPRKVAEDLLRNLLQRKPDSIPAIHFLAMLLQTGGHYDEAVRLYERILEIDPENAIAINNLAWLLCEAQKQCERALELANRGLEKTPNYADLLDTRGVVYYRLGRFEQAVQDLNFCISLYPRQSSKLAASNLHLAKVLVKLGRTTQAVETLKKALDQNGTVGGLTPDDLTEAKQLMQELSEGGN